MLTDVVVTGRWEMIWDNPKASSVMLFHRDDISSSTSPNLPATMIVKIYHHEDQYHTEVEAYNRMQSIHGVYVPEF